MLLMNNSYREFYQRFDSKIFLEKNKEYILIFRYSLRYKNNVCINVLLSKEAKISQDSLFLSIVLYLLYVIRPFFVYIILWYI